MNVLNICDCGGQKRVLGTVELEVWVVARNPTWVLCKNKISTAEFSRPVVKFCFQFSKKSNQFRKMFF